MKTKTKFNTGLRDQILGYAPSANFKFNYCSGLDYFLTKS